MNFFFSATIFSNVENPHISHISRKWFPGIEKLQAKLPKFAITIVLKPKNEWKKMPKTKNDNLLNCSVSMS